MKDHLFIMDALTDVDEDLIAQAEAICPKRPWKAWIAAAAALAILVSTIFQFPRKDTIPPSNLYAQDFITHPASPYEQGYIGNPYNEKAPTNITASVISPFRMALTAKVIEVLPDTYQLVGQQQGDFRLVRMRFIRALNTDCEGQYFYCMITEDQATSLNVFSTVVLNRMKQYGHSNHILYNATQDCLTALDFPLIGGGNIFAFQYGLLDYSFPGTAEYIEEQNKYFKSRRRHLSYPPTLEEFEIYLCGKHVGGVSETIYETPKVVNQKIADALEYVRPFENGIFIPSIDAPAWSYRNDEILYRRYVNGYPTNEAILITPSDMYIQEATPNGEELIDLEHVVTYGSRFSDEDLKELPDLTKALEKVTQDFDAGLITPGHIENWEDMEFISHSIFGWYDKTDEGVYGVIRVSWCYHGYRENNRSDVFRDDQYFLVELGSDTLRPIEHDELLEMGGGAYHFMPGQYGYDKYGRKDPPYTNYY